MSFDRYIELMQQLITMTDPDDEDQVLYARNILKNLLELARCSGKVDPLTIRSMHLGQHEFTHLLKTRDHFAGKPGDVAGNSAKRRRLAMMLSPHC